jgi:DNA-binding transcriptional LysR family regulator
MSTQLRDLSWDDLRIVKVIGETRNLAAAALATGMNQSTIFRRLGQIEESLGVILFERRRAGYQLSPAGAEVFALAQRVELDVVAVSGRLEGLDQEPEGVLRIATNDTLALHLLTPIFSGFRALHPAVRIDLIIGNSALNLARGETDIAIRATNAPPENLVGRRVATVAWAAYGRASDRPTATVGAEPIFGRTWITYGGELASLKASRRVEAEVAPQDIAYRVNSVEGVAAAIEAGLGLGYLPCLVGDCSPALTRVDAIDPALSDALWLLTHPDLRKSGRVHAFLGYCATSLIRQRSLIEGLLGDRTEGY